jgi:murein DD-endopeptidase MepM/ murein hydrolase activator NlpD
MFTKKHNKLISFVASFVILISTTGFSLGNNFTSMSCNNNIPDSQFDESSVVFISSSYEIVTEKDDLIYIPQMVWPVLDPQISSGYGGRESCQSCSSYHQGLDFTPGYGKPVVAAIDGTVVEIKDAGEYGLHIVVEHFMWIGQGETWHTVYAHLKRGSVPENIVVGSKVNMGDYLAAVGDTGLITGPHLHFEIRIEGKKVNPLPILKKYIVEEN